MLLSMKYNSPGPLSQFNFFLEFLNGNSSMIHFLANEMLERVAHPSVAADQDSVGIALFNYDFFARAKIHLVSHLFRNRDLKFLGNRCLWQAQSFYGARFGY